MKSFHNFLLMDLLLVYQGWQKGKMEIFFLGLLDKNNINITRNTLSNDIISHGNSFSPDGQSIVFTSERDGIGIFI